MNKQEVLDIIKQIMPDSYQAYDFPEEVVEEIWRNIKEMEFNLRSEKKNNYDFL